MMMILIVDYSRLLSLFLCKNKFRANIHVDVIPRALMEIVSLSSIQMRGMISNRLPEAI